MSIDLNLGSMNVSSLTQDNTAPGASPNPKKLAEAAKQFEALMISQMMKSARESSGGGWLSDGDETGEDSSMGMAEEQFAQSMANSGGLGLAKMVVRTMSKPEAKANEPPQSPAALLDRSL